MLRSEATSFVPTPLHRPGSLCFHQRPIRTTPCMKSKRRNRTAHSTTSPSSTVQTGQPRSPARINVENTTLSVREQIKLVKQYNQHQLQQEQGGRRLERTSFRKKKEEEFGMSPRRKRGKFDIDVPDGKYENDRQPLIFVDGYNVIGMWARLRKFRDNNNLEEARRRLLEQVTEFSSVRGWECVVVFDAQQTDEIEKKEMSDSGVVQIVFTGSETADSFIERSVFQHCKQEQQKRQIWAITSDLLQAKVTGSIGAHVMSASLFVQEIRQVRNEIKESLRQKNKKHGDAYRSSMLMSNVDSETLKKLYQLRDGA